MNKQYIYTGLIALLMLIVGTTNASALDLESIKKGHFEHRIIVGFNIGATAPIPIPREVRSIDSWWPQADFQLGYDVKYKIPNVHWGVSSGIFLNQKGMGIRDKVKYMYTEVQISNDGSNFKKGYFVGKNETRVKLSYITVPLNLLYMPNDKWTFSGGGYVSYLNSGNFEGEVWDGYLRENTPTGDKVIIGEDKATFDFGSSLRRFDYGISIGAERKINNRFGVYSKFDWGLNSIFHSSFNGVSFDMNNVYLTLGMSYRL